MGFKVIFTEGGRRSHVHAVDYLLNELENPFATVKLEKDIVETVALLETMALSHPILEDAILAGREIRKVHLKKHKYKIFYHIENDDEVHIDMILHDKQDIGKWLS